MRHLFVFLFLSFFLLSNSQEFQKLPPAIPEKKEEPKFRNVYQYAQIHGGIESALQYVKTHVKYPRRLKSKRIGGTIVVRYTVEKSRNIKNNFEIIQGLDPKLDEAVLKALNDYSPQWTPARGNGHSIRSSFFFPFTFGEIDTNQKGINDSEAYNLETQKLIFEEVNCLVNDIAHCVHFNSLWINGENQYRYNKKKDGPIVENSSNTEESIQQQLKSLHTIIQSKGLNLENYDLLVESYQIDYDTTLNLNTATVNVTLIDNPVNSNNRYRSKTNTSISLTFGPLIIYDNNGYWLDLSSLCD